MAVTEGNNSSPTALCGLASTWNLNSCYWDAVAPGDNKLPRKPQGLLLLLASELSATRLQQPLLGRCRFRLLSLSSTQSLSSRSQPGPRPCQRLHPSLPLQVSPPYETTANNSSSHSLTQGPAWAPFDILPWSGVLRAGASYSGA